MPDLVHSLTGICPTVALHVRWDLAGGIADVPIIKAQAKAFGVNPSSINPDLFEDQNFKFGSFGNHDPAIRAQAVEHVRESIRIADYLGSPCLPLWT
jgi:L-rhamnose isomerase/sugar isomerase